VNRARRCGEARGVRRIAVRVEPDCSLPPGGGPRNEGQKRNVSLMPPFIAFIFVFMSGYSVDLQICMSAAATERDHRGWGRGSKWAVGMCRGRMQGSPQAVTKIVSLWFGATGILVPRNVR
jgi:hypothetical protein